jgi:hypothetical protein
MLLGGLWHGAGWPFLIWGALHGLYLIINHAWRRLMIISGLNLSSNRIYQLFSWSITFISVVIAWVYFRAPTLEHGNAILGSMFGMNGAQIPAGLFARLGTFQDTIISFGIEANMSSGTVFVSNFIWVFFAGLVVFLLPNVAQIFHKHEPVIYENSEVFKKEIIKTRFLWKYSLFWAVTSSLLFLSGVLTLTQVSEFLYFQF